VDVSAERGEHVAGNTHQTGVDHKKKRYGKSKLERKTTKQLIQSMTLGFRKEFWGKKWVNKKIQNVTIEDLVQKVNGGSCGKVRGGVVGISDVKLGDDENLGHTSRKKKT